MTLCRLWISSLLIPLYACGTPEPKAEPAVITPAPVASSYVGSEACKECHQDQWAAWSESHHREAIQRPSQDSVLGHFHGAAIAPEQAERPVVDAAGAFSVQSEVANQTPKTYPVRYTFGHSPLQQYLLDVGEGRLQAWSWAWDSRSEGEGGQRWFSLSPGLSTAPGDPLHWTGRGFNWNSMCADCHSTGIEKNYSTEDDSYDTRFAELAVGCEACHGPASKHLNWARTDSNSPRAGLVELDGQQGEINACAQCHSRRVQLKEAFNPSKKYLNHYAPALLEEGLYHPDGQINEEVYVYGSFLQSRMHRQGVTCSHCHEPHGAALRESGNNLCTQCHSPTANKDFPSLKAASYDHPDHTFHPKDSPGAQCVSCHMPTKIYMGADRRHDHGFRLPRPDLSISLGVPDPCLNCHKERDSRWSQAQLEAHHTEARPAHFATVLEHGRKGVRAAEPELARLARDTAEPVMVRATAASLLGNYGGEASAEALAVLVSDSEPLVRLGAAAGLRSLQPAERWRLGSTLLADELLAVRLQGFEALLEILRPGEQTPAPFREVMAEYLEAQELQAEHPESHTNLALLHTAMGDLGAAQAAYERALARQPHWIPALINGAELARAQGDGERERELLGQALAAAPENTEVNYAKALWMTRQRLPKDAIPFYTKARDLAPNHAHYWYALGLAQLAAGSSPAAMQTLEQAVQRWPAMSELRLVLVSEHTKAGHFPKALDHAQALVDHDPGDPRNLALLQQVKAKATEAK